MCAVVQSVLWEVLSGLLMALHCHHLVGTITHSSFYLAQQSHYLTACSIVWQIDGVSTWPTLQR